MNKVFITQNDENSHLFYYNGTGERTNSNTMTVRSEVISVNKPLIFTKKRKVNVKTIPLKVIITDTGRTRHYPSGVQEWDKSVYSYNNNYTKLLTVADNNLTKIVKSYFSLSLKKKSKIKSIKKHSIKYRKPRRRLYLKKKRLSLNKILIAKGNVKHTSTSAVITLYIYNLERKILINKKKFFEIQLEKWFISNINEKIIQSFEFPEIIRKKNKEWEKKIANLLKTVEKDLNNNKISAKIYHNFFSKYKYLDIHKYNKHKWSKETLNNLKLSLFKSDLETMKSFFISDYILKYTSRRFEIFNDIIKYIINLSKKKNILENRYSRLLNLNKKKFDNVFIENLRNIASNIYNKNVIFNIVNLNKFYLNSNIYAQIISWKLRNRKNNISYVLIRSLENIDIPHTYKGKANSNNRKIFINNVRNRDVYSLLYNKIRKGKNFLNKILLKFYPIRNPYTKTIKQNKTNDSFEILVRKSLKNQVLAGVRVEISGRLTRRFKASRSLSKLRWIGGLRNIDSSYLGLSAVILRGHKKSNVDYTFLSSKRRIGAFGVKGWVSSM